jgi:hypothetical protein
MNHKLHLIVLALICFINSNLIHAQGYEPMLGDLNEWQVTACFGGCNTSTYYTDGDTVVGGLDYKILDGYHYSSRTFLLREDVQERQVFLMKINPTKEDEWLMYDFSMQVGDSIELFNPISPYPFIAGFYELDSIVSRPLEDLQMYRHFYLSPTNSNTQSDEYPIWVESVGSLSLINGPASTPDFNGGGQLSCYFKDGESRYFNSDSIQSCDQEHFLSLTELSKETQFNFYPNPSKNSFTISSNLNEFNRGEIIDINGNLVFKFNFTQDETYYHGLEPGIYFIKLLNEKNITREQKLIVVR